MDAAQLQATLAANKGPLMAGGVAVVGAIALYQRKKSGNAAASGRTPAQADNSENFSAGAQLVGTAGAYDSTASDLYATISPQLEALSQQFSKATDAPVPVPTPTVPKITPGYYQRAGSTAVYYQDASGRLDLINKKEGDALKKAAGKKGLSIKTVAADNGFWRNRTVIGSTGGVKLPGMKTVK